MLTNVAVVTWNENHSTFDFFIDDVDHILFCEQTSHVDII
jgi:hypothetical protein